MQLILITGLSGSGKSVALNVLEDSSFYCVDNLPAKLLPELVGFLTAAGYERVALSIDVRGGTTLTELPRQIADLKRAGVEVSVLFLDAKADTLIKRYSETRRRHPLSDSALTLPECIARERELLTDIADLAHRVDTSDLSPNTLRSWVKDFVGLAGSGLTLLFESFGYKNGIPLDADLVFDVRCLPNPHYDPQLRPLTGKDQTVIDFLSANSDTQKMLDDIRRFVENWLPSFNRDNRSYLTVAVGCTGGRHRSVYLAEVLAGHFRTQTPVLVRHRELS
ncbi:MAG: RNase adaptor protein RapZ [Betaproteobacteria bacterium RIFCSPLOWO2_12_FULL_62_58]|nr:MAG: RNase adaptor protein RapZ [Betaproteobacteria bacterium RIFCSPLOWO2_12_FULL_62_58]